MWEAVHLYIVSVVVVVNVCICMCLSIVNTALTRLCRESECDRQREGARITELYTVGVVRVFSCSYKEASVCNFLFLTFLGYTFIALIIPNSVFIVPHPEV